MKKYLINIVAISLVSSTAFAQTAVGPDPNEGQYKDMGSKTAADVANLGICEICIKNQTQVEINANTNPQSNDQKRNEKGQGGAQ